MTNRRTRRPMGERSGGVVLFDTYSMVFRAFHALPPMTTSGNEPTGALYGACALILKVLREHQPKAFAFALDAPKRTFRHERYPAYKSQREAAPSDLVVQLQRLPDLLAAFEVPVWCAPGYEADDVIATLSTRLANDREPTSVLIVSGDRDLLQLVDTDVRVSFIGARGKPAMIYDVAAVRERFGVDPERLPTWTALVGDTSDNLVGAPGIGPRTATQLVAAYGTMDVILDRVSEVRAAKVRESLTQHGDPLRLNEELARLRRDVPLERGPAVQPLTPGAVQRLEQCFTQLEFRSLMSRLKPLGPDVQTSGP